MAKKKASAQKSSTGTPAVVALQKAGIAHTLHPYELDKYATVHQYGQEAAEALGLSADVIFKTLLADVDGGVGLAVAVVPVSASLDLKSFAAAAGGKKAQLAQPTVAERTTGYVVGGISPLGQKRPLPTVVDASALELDSMYVSAGRRGLQVELAPQDLVRLTAATTAPIARR
jgi:Cys-tRNA(Pro)/Cys-tRNA(Cys) deacylase